MNSFKPGDEIVAIESYYHGSESEFTKGNTYIVDIVFIESIRVIADDRGRSNGWYKETFVLKSKYDFDNDLKDLLK